MGPPLKSSAKTLIYFYLLGTSGKTIHSKREREKDPLVEILREKVLQISNMQLVSYQKQVCVCGTWAAGDGLCDMMFYSCFTLSQRSKENYQHSGMMRVFGGKCSRSTKSTLAVTHVIDDDLSLDGVTAMDQPIFTSYSDV